MRKKNPYANAEKQKRFREKQKALGKKMVRGYVTPQALTCYEEILDKTNLSDSEVLSNAVRITYAAYKKGQIRMLNQYLEDNDL